MPPKNHNPLHNTQKLWSKCPYTKSQSPNPSVHGKESWMKAEQLSSVGPLRKGRNASYLLSLWIIYSKYMLFIHPCYLLQPPLHNACNYLIAYIMIVPFDGTPLVPDWRSTRASALQTVQLIQYRKCIQSGYACDPVCIELDLRSIFFSKQEIISARHIREN